MMLRIQAAVLFFLASVSTLSAAEKIAESAYYPFAVGNEWVYRLTVAGNAQTVSVKIAKHELINGVLCARAETFINGRAVAAEYIMAKKDGIFRVKALDFESKPAIRIFMLPVKEGATWKVNSKVSNQTVKGTYTMKLDTVKVPAGEFKKAVFVKSPKMELGPTTWDVTGVYVKGVGLVYQKITTDTGRVVVQELKEFKPAKTAIKK